MHRFVSFRSGLVRFALAANSIYCKYFCAKGKTCKLIFFACRPRKMHKWPRSRVVWAVGKTMENIQIIEQKIKRNPIKKATRNWPRKRKKAKRKKTAQLYHNKGGKEKQAQLWAKKENSRKASAKTKTLLQPQLLLFSVRVCVCVCGMCPQGFSAAQVMRNANRHTGGATERTSISFMFRKILQYLLKPKIMKPERK